MSARRQRDNSVGLPNRPDPADQIPYFPDREPAARLGQWPTPFHNNYMIDGVSVNSQNWGGAAVVTPNQESVKEITGAHSNAYSAEYGRNSGAQV